VRGCLLEMPIKNSFSLILLIILSVAANAQRTIDGIRVGIINGAATYLPLPKYPQEAEDLCVGGKVEIEVLISEKGNVIEAKAISGDELLRDVAVKAVRKAKFKWMTDGKPVKRRGIVVYNFDSLAKCLTVGIVNKRAVILPKPKVINLSQPRLLQNIGDQIVGVQVIIDMNGKVISARAISGHPLLRSFCVYAATQAKFSPTLIDGGQPIKIKALLAYKFKPDGTIDTDIERDDKTVIGTPINLVEPPPPFCNCRGLGGSVLVQAKIDEQGNVIEAKAFSGHPVLRIPSEKAALESKFLPTNTKAKIVISYNFDSNDGGRTAKLKNIEIKEVKF
jgi:TonB family protein